MAKVDFLERFEKEYSKREFNINETLRVLKSSGSIFWSWGVERLVNVQNKGLLLTVNGHFHKGLVLITLAWDDTYTVQYFSRQYNEKFEKQEMVYVDMLVDIIDGVIETH